MPPYSNGPTQADHAPNKKVLIAAPRASCTPQITAISITEQLAVPLIAPIAIKSVIHKIENKNKQNVVVKTNVNNFVIRVYLYKTSRDCDLCVIRITTTPNYLRILVCAKTEADQNKNKFTWRCPLQSSPCTTGNQTWNHQS